MRAINEAAMDAIASGEVVVSGAAYIATAPAPVAVWGGFVPLEIDSVTYQPIGNRGLVSVSGGAIGGAEQDVTLSLNGVDPANLALLDALALRRVPVILYRLIFDGAGINLLDYHVFTRGRLDLLSVEETPAGEATITASIEGAARGLGRASGRTRSDADQRLIDAADGGLSGVSFAGNKTLYLGGKPPAGAMSATPSVYQPSNGDGNDGS